MTFPVPPNKLLSPVCQGTVGRGAGFISKRRGKKKRKGKKNPEVNNPFPLQNHSPPLRNRSATRALPCGGSPNREPWKLSGTSRQALTARTVKVWDPRSARQSLLSAGSRWLPRVCVPAGGGKGGAGIPTCPRAASVARLRARAGAWGRYL